MSQSSQNTKSNTLPEMGRAVIEVFGGCNFKCDMCPQTVGRGKDWTRKMPLDLFENILKQLNGKPIINLEGSGEPTMAKDLYKYVQLCTDYGFDSFIYTNGSKLTGDLLQKCILAGLKFIRYSCIGYDNDTYSHWMKNKAGHSFDDLMGRIQEAKDNIAEVGSDCKVSTYHLILDNEKLEEETKLYQDNVVNKMGITGYIWKMHNWSGNYDPAYGRESEKKRTCGRPFSNEITIRSGGNNGSRGGVTPCCQTMGQPNEAKSVLGHADETSLVDIWYGEEYEKLREGHRTGDYPDYCKSCDFLYDNPEVLVWSNDGEAKVDHMLGTDFDLR